VDGNSVTAAGTRVGNSEGAAVGRGAFVAVALGEQATSPPSIPNAPSFKASRREIFLDMEVPPNLNNVPVTGGVLAL
jgi:hypothetical protein